jgi:hypothetical protein
MDLPCSRPCVKVKILLLELGAHHQHRLHLGESVCACNGCLHLPPAVSSRWECDEAAVRYWCLITPAVHHENFASSLFFFIAFSSVVTERPAGDLALNNPRTPS